MKFFKHVFLNICPAVTPKTKVVWGGNASQKIRTYNTCMNQTNCWIPDFCVAGNQKQIISEQCLFYWVPFPNGAMGETSDNLKISTACLRSILSPSRWPTLKLFGGIFSRTNKASTVGFNGFFDYR